MKTDRTRPNPSPERLSGVIQATASRASTIATPETAPDNTVKQRPSGDEAAVISGFHPKSTRGLPSRDRFGAQSEMGRILTHHWYTSKIRGIGWRSERCPTDRTADPQFDAASRSRLSANQINEIAKNLTKSHDHVARGKARVLIGIDVEVHRCMCCIPGYDVITRAMERLYNKVYPVIVSSEPCCGFASGLCAPTTSTGPSSRG